MIKCDIGKQAVDGDYVLVDNNHSYVKNYCIGRVYQDKVYTGKVIGWKNTKQGREPKFLHRLDAIMVVDLSNVSQQTIDDINYDISLHCKDYTGDVPKMGLKRYLQVTHLDSMDKVWAAFKLCADFQDLDFLINILKNGYGACWGTFSYLVENGVVTVQNIGLEYTDGTPQRVETIDFTFYPIKEF